MASKKWSDLNSFQKRGLAMVGAVEIVMTLAAWRDIYTRPASRVRGPKPMWAIAVLVQPVGPFAYFALGRQ